MTHKIVFMGSPFFAVRILETLTGGYDVVGVVTQPDKPAGRGRNMTPPPVKKFALSRGISVIQPARLKEPGVLEQLRDWDPSVIVVAAFGQILRQTVLDLPKFGCINVHASYLPRWRGAAPIQAAILNGDENTGVSIMRMDAGIDTGPVLLQRKISIANDETMASLTAKLADLGAGLLLEALRPYLLGQLQATPQPEVGDTYAPMLTKEEGLLDFSQPACVIDRKVRALNDWPGTFCVLQGDQLLKIRKIEVIHADAQHPGSRSVIDKVPAISTPDAWIKLLEVQPAGKKWMSGADFLRGTQNWGSQP